MTSSDSAPSAEEEAAPSVDPAEPPAPAPAPPAPTVDRLGRFRRGVVDLVTHPVAVTGIALGVFLAGFGSGWWVSDRTNPGYSPEVRITIADDAGAGPDARVMPDVRGLTEGEARQVFADVGLTGITLTVRTQPSIGTPGTVVGQDPPGGSPLSTTVALALAAPAVVPDVVGTDVARAAGDLQALGATVEVRRLYRVGAAVDTVLAVEPAAGQPVTEHVVLEVAAPAASVYLDELKATGSSCSTGEAAINAIRYPHTLSCRAGSAAFTEAVYLLDRRTASVEAVLGQPDAGQPGQRVRIEIVADGKVVAGRVMAYGESASVSVATAGVLRLVLRVRVEASTDASGGATGAFGDVRLLGGAADIAALRARP